MSDTPRADFIVKQRGEIRDHALYLLAQDLERELGETRASISRSFGVSQTTVKYIVERRAWRSVA